MTIEALIGLSSQELEALSNNSVELEKHFGWCLEITRPDSHTVKERLAGKKKPISASKLEKIKQLNELDAGKEFARKEAARLGIKLDL